jgi:hypothetical protein
VTYSAADLEMVDRHIADGERHILLQEELISRLKSRGLPTDVAEDLLEEFWATLRQHRGHRSMMVSNMDQEQ